MEYGDHFVRASTRSRSVLSLARGNVWRIDNFKSPTGGRKSECAHYTRVLIITVLGERDILSPTTLKAQLLPDPLKVPASWALCGATALLVPAFPLMAVYGFNCGMLHKRAATAFFMVL